LLWAGGVCSHFVFQRTPEDLSWTAPAFLGAAAAILLASEASNRGWLISVGVAGLCFEFVGVHSGFPFGSYFYTEVLQPQLAGVPIVLACAWMTLLAYVSGLLWRLRLPSGATVVIGAFWMAGLDLLIDPVATLALDYWRWCGAGAYFGVPLSNFAGWLIVSALLLASARGARVRGRVPHWLGLSVVVFFGLIGLAHGLQIPAAIALVQATAHVWISRRDSAGDSGS
jgi:putative membrane protein